MAREKTVKITVRIFETDHEQLKEFYGALGYNKGIRLVLRKHVEQLRRGAGKHLQEDQGLETPTQGIPTPEISW